MPASHEAHLNHVRASKSNLSVSFARNTFGFCWWQETAVTSNLEHGERTPTNKHSGLFHLSPSICCTLYPQRRLPLQITSSWYCQKEFRTYICCSHRVIDCVQMYIFAFNLKWPLKQSKVTGPPLSFYAGNRKQEEECSQEGETGRWKIWGNRWRTDCNANTTAGCSQQRLTKF